MGYDSMLRTGLLIALCLIGGLLQAADILVLGLFRDMAILRVDGKQYKLRTGEVSPEGIKLIAANSEEAILEINGRRETYQLGNHISSSFSAPEKTGAIIRPVNGMYKVPGFINRQPVEFLVDTGASSIAMNANQARKLGINFRYEGEEGYSSTASGYAKIYKLKLDSVQVGDIVVKNVEAAVLEGNFPTTTLLGMSFLNRVNMKRDGQLLMLEKKW
jgi:aspartyl protease family protein